MYIYCTCVCLTCRGLLQRRGAILHPPPNSLGRSNISASIESTTVSRSAPTRESWRVGKRNLNGVEKHQVHIRTCVCVCVCVPKICTQPIAILGKVAVGMGSYCRKRERERERGGHRCGENSLLLSKGSVKKQWMDPALLCVREGGQRHAVG